jgi:hypothetical protein
MYTSIVQGVSMKSAHSLYCGYNYYELCLISIQFRTVVVYDISFDKNFTSGPGHKCLTVKFYKWPGHKCLTVKIQVRAYPAALPS